MFFSMISYSHARIYSFFIVVGAFVNSFTFFYIVMGYFVYSFTFFISYNCDLTTVNIYIYIYFALYPGIVGLR